MRRSGFYRTPATQPVPERSVQEKVTARRRLLATTAAVLITATAVAVGVAVKHDGTPKQVTGCELRIPGQLPDGNQTTEWGISNLAVGNGNVMTAEDNFDYVNHAPNGLDGGIVSAGDIALVPKEYCRTLWLRLPDDVSALPSSTDNNQG
jgi:hypothetical protein